MLKLASLLGHALPRPLLFDADKDDQVMITPTTPAATIRPALRLLDDMTHTAELARQVEIHRPYRPRHRRQQEAAFQMVAGYFNPRQINLADLERAADWLFAAQAITQADQERLKAGSASHGYPIYQASASFDAIDYWQNQMAAALGGLRMSALSEATRVLSILGRIAALQEADD